MDLSDGHYVEWFRVVTASYLVAITFILLAGRLANGTPISLNDIIIKVTLSHSLMLGFLCRRNNLIIYQAEASPPNHILFPISTTRKKGIKNYCGYERC